MSAHEGTIKTTNQTKTPTNIVICGWNTTKFIPNCKTSTQGKREEKKRGEKYSEL